MEVRLKSATAAAGQDLKLFISFS